MAKKQENKRKVERWGKKFKGKEGLTRREREKGEEKKRAFTHSESAKPSHCPEN